MVNILAPLSTINGDLFIVIKLLLWRSQFPVSFDNIYCQSHLLGLLPDLSPPYVSPFSNPGIILEPNTSFIELSLVNTEISFWSIAKFGPNIARINWFQKASNSIPVVSLNCFRKYSACPPLPSTKYFPVNPALLTPIDPPSFFISLRKDSLNNRDAPLDDPSPLVIPESAGERLVPKTVFAPSIIFSNMSFETVPALFNIEPTPGILLKYLKYLIGTKLRPARATSPNAFFNPFSPSYGLFLNNEFLPV